jgi:RimJ/RimL family protein N-acetyltransferase
LNAYSHFNIREIGDGDYSIIPLREQDIFDIKEWRNAQLDFLRQREPLTHDEQSRYYRYVVSPSFTDTAPAQMLFSFLLNSVCIGYGGITNINWESKRTELSFLLDTHRAADPDVYVKEFSVYLTLTKQLVFRRLQFNRIFTETYDIRPLHVSVLENNGFVQEGRMRQHVYIKGRFVDSLIHGFTKEQYDIG